ncbi:MAG TPA: hypothetical protein VHE82_03405 [Gemmatimonadaceae bacterium]|nr:hypothetical protein [Gemmatimonadaceae bacterium]
MIFRRVAPQPDGSRKRLSQPFLVSVGVHLVVAVALMRMLIVNMDISSKPKRQTAPDEHVGFVRISSPGVKTPVPGRSGGDGKPLTPREVHVVAPVSIPTTIPAPSGPVTKATEEGTGPLVGTGGPTRGVRPQYSDPRVWEPPGPVVSAPKSVKQTIDSLIADAIGPYNDSVAAAAQRRDPTDWTIEKGGYKWGIDRRAIRLGPVSIPTALLAMLPLNLQGNPSTMQRDRSYAAMNRDITWHAQQAINEADFMKAVRSIRERKERERAAALAGPSVPAKDRSGDQKPE